MAGLGGVARVDSFSADAVTSCSVLNLLGSSPVVPLTPVLGACDPFQVLNLEETHLVFCEVLGDVGGDLSCEGITDAGGFVFEGTGLGS